MPERPAPRRSPIAALALLVPLLAFLLPSPAAAQAPLRKIGEMELSLLGLSATVDPLEPVVPKSIASAVRVVVRAGASDLSAVDLERFLGPLFQVKGELSGPGLKATLTLPHLEDGEPLPADPLLLPLPALTMAGDYEISNLRIEKQGLPVLDVTPSRIPLKVIDQILVTSVKTRPLTLDEIRARGVDLTDPDNYLGFSFAIGMKLESKVVNIEMPVVFDRQGRVVPEPLEPPPAPPRTGISLPPTIVPVLMQPEEGSGPVDGPASKLELPGGNGGPFSIPALLVIPGDVGYLRQFFTAQLFVANGAPVGSGLVVRDITGTIKLPPRPSEEPGNAAPLSLPPLVRDGVSSPHPETLPVMQVGPDGIPGTEDDDPVLRPAEQGMADFTIRGDREGFHRIDFDIRAELLGLPVGAVRIKGKASGGVLVQNAKFKLSFVAPSVVRADEEFTLDVMVTNLSESTTTNLLTLTLPADQMSGVELAVDEHGVAESAKREVETLGPQETAVFEYRFVARETGQVVAGYINFGDSTPDGTSGDLRFKLAVGERGVPLSPDTLVLPTSVGGLPNGVVRAAMRVLGQAWSVANAPAATLPKTVVRTDRTVVKQKALALAEAGLRVTLGQPVVEAVRDIGYDFWSGTPSFDPGFDQLLRTTRAGHELARAIGAAIAAPAAAAGPLEYERDLAGLLASGPDFVSFAVASASGGSPDLMLTDGLGRRTLSAGTPLPPAAVPTAVLLPLGSPATAPLLGLVTSPGASPYHLALLPTATGPVDLSVTLPRGDGTVVRASATGVALVAGERARVILDLQRPESLVLEHDVDADGLFERTEPLVVDSATRFPEGPSLRAARIVGPRTVASASPLGVYAAFLFDRVVGAASAAELSHYRVPKNQVLSAKRQLSGRIVFASLELPEGNYVPTTVSVEGLEDTRGVAGPASGEAALVSLIADPGAIVTGRVLNGDGSPLPPGVVVRYLADSAWQPVQCIGATAQPVSALPVDDNGAFELRYVRQSLCGLPFELLTQDPANGAVTKVSGRVRGPGERIVMDIALLAKGSVLGTVTRFTSAGSLEKVPVPGALVRVFSVTESQSFGEAVTDGDGRYRVDGITVGPVAVHAAQGLGVGNGSGRIDRPGTPAVVDLTLDDNAVQVSGTVYKVDPNEPDPEKRTSTVPGIQVVCRLGGIVVGATFTDAAGHYVLESMPAGVFTVSAALNSRDKATSPNVSGSRGVPVTVDLHIEIPLETSPELGTVRGRVFFADGTTPAPGVQVSVQNRGVLTAEGTAGGPPVGSFEIRGIPVGTASTLLARHPDGKRTASRTFSFAPVPSPVFEANLVLSDLGEARFVVQDAQGQPLARQDVWLQGICLNPCGCRKAVTGPNGEPAVFHDLPVGSVMVRSYLPGATFTDVARASATIRGSEPGQHGEAVLRFAGAGAISGTVLDPPQTASAPGPPSQGVEVVLSSRVFLNDGEQVCDFVAGESHRTRSDGEGKFAFRNVPVGGVQLRARHEFLNTTIGRTLNLTHDGHSIPDVVLQFTDTMARVLSGVVTLPDGVTLAGPGVEVTVNGPLPDVTVSTNAASVYRFAEILPEGGYTLTARDPETGFTTRTSIFLRAGQPATHDLRLLGTGKVKVRVVDGAGEPVEQAVVRLRETGYPAGSYETVLSAANEGTATFGRVFEGGFSVEVSDSFGRGGRASGTMPRPGETVEVTARLTTTGTVTGRFRMPGEGGAPIPLGTVKLLAGGKTIGRVTTGTTGDDVGRYSFEYVPAGAIRVEAQDPLTARTGFNVGSLETDGQTLQLDIVAQAIGNVVGEVTLNGGEVPQARVEVVSGAFKATTFSDEHGLYRLDGVPEGLVVVTATRSGGDLAGTASKTLKEEGKDVEIDVALRATGRLFGRVRTALGAPAPISVVTVQAGGQGGGTQSAITRQENGENGHYEFPQVPAGLVTITVDTLASIDRGKTVVEIPAGGEVEQDVDLNGVGAIEGTVVDVPGGYETHVAVNGTGTFTYNLRAMPYPQPNGGFRLPEVLAGPFTATLSTRYGPLKLAGVVSGTVFPDQTAEITLEVQPTGRLEAYVTRSDDEPAFGADVTVKTPDGNLTSVVEEDGWFRLDGVVAGKAITVSIADRLTGGVGKGQGVVPDGGTLTLDPIRLDDTPIAVLTVEPADGARGLALDTPVRLVFSDPLDAASVHASTIHVKAGTATRSVSPTLEGEQTVVLRPYGSWPDSAELVVTATTGVADVFGRRLQQTFTSRFRTVDLSPPEVVAVDPPNLAIQVGSGAVVRLTFDEPLGSGFDATGLVALARSGGVPVPGAVTLGEDRRQAVFTPADGLLPNERYTVTENGAEDASGNRQTAAFVSSFTTTDTLPPVLAASSPAEGSWTSNGRPGISIQLSDPQPGSGIDTTPGSASLKLDGVAVVASLSAGALSYTPRSSLADGQHTVVATARDRAGNEGALATPRTFGVDLTAPTEAAITAPTEDQTVRGPIEVKASATDEPSGVASIRVYLDGKPNPLLTLTAPTFTGTWSTTGIDDGPHALTARAVDEADNLGPAGAARTVLVDNDPLEVSILSPTPASRFRDRVTVRAGVSEPVSRVDFAVGSQAAVAGSKLDEKTYQAELDLGALAEGEHTVTVAAVDLLDNGASASVVVVVDRSPPAAPDGDKITAEESDGGVAWVWGLPRAVEGTLKVGTATWPVTVRVTRVATGAHVATTAAQDGSFSVQLPASLGDELSLVAIDAVGNESAATVVAVGRSTVENGVPLEGLALWVSADQGVTTDAEGRVEAWADRSDQHNDLSQATTGNRPLPATDQGGRSVVRFDGSNDSLRFTSRLAAARTVFWVAAESTSATSDYRPLLVDSAVAKTWLGGYGAPGPIWHVNTHASVKGGQTWLNGALVDGERTPRPRTPSVLSVVTASGVGADRFGCDTDGCWWGDLVELLVYDRALGPGERQAVEDYLVRRHQLYTPAAGTPAITPAGGPFEGSTSVRLSTTTPGATIRFTLDGTPPTDASPLYAQPFEIAETTTVKARAFRAGFLDSPTATATFVRKDDSPVSAGGGPVLWLAGDAGIATDGGPWVTEWADQSGQANHAHQVSGSKAPQLVPEGANGLPVLRFDAGDEVRFTRPIAGIRTVFWVVSESTSATSDYRPLLVDSAVAKTWLGGYGAPGTIWHVNTHASVRSGQAYLNGAPVDGQQAKRPRTLSVISAVTTSGVGADRFGCDTDGCWWGDLAELIVYDRALTAVERKGVEDYLLAKYATTGAVTTPAITPAGGVFTESVEVRLSTQTRGAEIRYTLDGTEPTVDSAVYAAPLEVTSTLTVKAKAWKDGLAESATAAAGFTRAAEATPKAVSGLQLWWRADAGVPSGTGEYWADQSGQGNDGYQTSGTAVARLVPNVANGLPVVRFDGGDGIRFTRPIAGIRTVFWVVSESVSATSDYRPLLVDSAVAKTWLGGYGAPGTIWYSGTHAAVRNGQTYLNGAPVDGQQAKRPRTLSVISAVTTSGVGADRFGCDTDGCWWGDLAELIVYDRALGWSERRQVEDYLGAKYQLLTRIRASLTGTVTARDGTTPVPGTSVSLASGPTATADGQGRYAVDDLDAGPEVVSVAYTSAVASRTFATSASVTLAAGANEKALALPMAVIRGRVTDSGGPALPGAALQACGRTYASASAPGVTTCVSTTADDDGDYLLLGTPAWGRRSTTDARFETVTLTGSVPSGDQASVAFSYNDSSTGTEERNISIAVRRVVKAQVLDSLDRPVAGASLSLTAPGWESGTTDAEGRFAFTTAVLAGAVVRVFVETPDGLTAEGTGTVQAGSDLDLTIRLHDARLRLSLLDQAGQLTEGAVEVTSLQQAQYWGGDWGAYERPQSVTTSGTGEVELRVASGYFRAVFDDGVTPPAGADGELADGEVRSVTLHRGSHVRLPQRLAGDERAYATDPGGCASDACGGFVDLYAASTAEPGVARSEILGQGLRSLRSARKTLRVQRLRYVPPSGRFARIATVVTNAGPATEVVFDSSLQATTDQPGAVLTATGSGDLVFGPDDAFAVAQPTTGAAFAAVLGGALVADGAWFDDGTCGGECAYAPRLGASYRAPIAAGGRVVFVAFSVFGDATEVEARARALADLSDPEALAGLTPEEQEAIVNFIRPPSGEVTGTVRSAGGPVPQAAVGAVSEARLVGFAEADDDGAFAMALLPGTFSLVALDPETGRPGRREIAVAAGEATDGSLSLLGDESVGRVRVGVTRGEGSEPAAGAVVRLEADGYSPVWRPRLVLDADGGGLFENVPAGTVTVRIEAPEVGEPQVVTVEPGVETPVFLRLSAWSGGLPADLTGADGVPYVVAENGAVVGGVDDCRPLCEGGLWGGYPASAQALRRLDGREAVFGPFWLDGGAKVTRRVFVPSSGRFARVLDVVENFGPARHVSLSRSLRLRSRSGAAWRVDAENGTAYGPDARWVVLSEAGASEVGLVLGGAGASLPTSTWHRVHVEYWGEGGGREVPEEWDVEDPWTLPVPEQGTAILVQFVVLGPDGGVLDTARGLAELTDPEALAGLTSAERAAIVNFAVPGGADLHARVTDASGAPVAGARVALVGADGRIVMTGTTDANGDVVFYGAPAGEWSLVALGADGRPGAVAVVVGEGETPEVTLALPSDGDTGSLLVRGVIGTDGPATGAAVGLWVDGLSPFWAPKAVFDAASQALFAAVPPGAVTVSWEPPYAPGPTTVSVAAGQRTEVVLTAAPIGDVEGIVLAGDGETRVREAAIRVLDAATGDALGETTSDGQGFYRFDDVVAGLAGFRLEVTSPNGTTTASVAAGFTTPGETLTRHLALPVSVVKGHAVDADGVTPVAGASVTVTRTDPAGNVDSWWGFETDAEGAFVVFEAPLGEFVLDVQDPYGLTASVAGRLDDITVAAVVDARLPGHGTVTGVVTDAGGNPLANADVGLRSLDRGFDQLSRTGADGAYRFERVAVGPLLVQAVDAGQVRRTDWLGLGAEGETVTANLELPPTGTVNGSVLAPDGVTPASAWVTIENLENDGPFGPFRAYASAYGGSYSLSGVPVGNVRVSATDSYSSVPPGLSLAALAAGAPQTANVVLGSAVSLPFALDGADGFRYLAHSGSVGDQRIGAVDYSWELGLRIGGEWPSWLSAGGVEDGGREIVFGPFSPAGLRVTRKMHSPAAGGFIRVLEILENPGPTDLTVPVRVEGGFAAGRASRLLVGPAATGGTYAVLDQGTACCHPALAHVFGGAGAPLALASAEYADGREWFAYRWDVTIPAGETVALLHFAAHGPAEDVAGVEARAQALAGLTEPEALSGLSADERSRVLNFSVPQVEP